MNYEDRYRQNVSEIDAALNRAIPETGAAQKALIDAMRYSLLAGGKRMRPIFLLEFCRACGGDPRKAMPFACAMEMIHTYSLIHDDLPCMDDDDLRRGRPTNHKVYGEATALLAGDGLLNAAFETMLGGAAAGIPADTAREAASVIAAAAGCFGMIGGQVLDMENEGRAAETNRIVLTYGLKTGAIIAASCEAGCILAGASAEKRNAAVTYAKAIGLAFQVIDDILNDTGSAAQLGKPVGSDAERRKMTLVEAWGIRRCEDLAGSLTREAKQALTCFEDNGFLLWFSDYLAARQH